MITKNDITKIDARRYKKFINKFNKYEIYLAQCDRLYDLCNNETKEFYQPYLNIIKNTTVLLKELHLDNPLDASKTYEYLLWNGYFSQNKHFTYNDDTFINPLVPGTDIMLGKAVCLNNAEMLTRVLQELNIESYLIGAYYNIPKQNLKEKNNTTLKDKALAYMDELKIKNILYGNHALTLIKNNNKFFLDDPTGQLVLNFEMKINPWLFITNNDNITYNKTKEIILTTYKYSNEEIITEQYLLTSFYKVNTILRENKNLLNDFYGENKKDIDIICKTLKKEKKY